MDSASILSTMKSFYVTISRAKEGAEIFTDDAGRLRNVIAKSTGERVSALEAIGFRDAMRNLNAEHQAAALLRNGGPDEAKIYFLKFGDEKDQPYLTADRSDREPDLPGIERPKDADPEMRGDRSKEHEPDRNVEKGKLDRAEDEGKERAKAPEEDRFERDLRESQEHNRGVPQERDQSDERDQGYER
ncbi:MAG: hypothetical protein P8Q48_23000 [Paracoccaceae bacterium]|nr:hypothetical protein [Paracoccaceae bacterium]